MTAAGFADPVFDSQATFRALLDAMSRPGTRRSCGLALAPPSPLTPASAALLLSLADFETPLHLSSSLAGSSDVRAFLAFHTGAPLVEAPSGAAFALVDATHDRLDLLAFAPGTPAYPDRSTTVIVQVAAFDTPDVLIVSGPGVRSETRFGFAPRPLDFVEQWAANRSRFPLGVDLVFAAENEIVALPRSSILRGG